jgi:hypothetical protein
MKRYSSILILVLISALSAVIFQNTVGARKDFYNELWGPAYLFVHGNNPYDTLSLNPVLPAVWLPMGIVFFAPLGWLNETAAAQTWYLINVVELFVVLWLALGDSKSALTAGLAGLFAFFFPLTINHFALGQFSITAMLGLSIAAKFAEKKKDWLAAFLLALALTKPQLGFFAAIGLGFFYFTSSGPRGAIQFYAKTFCVALILCLPFFIASPAWIQSWLANMQRNPSWAHPSIFLMLGGNWKNVSFGIALLAGIAATLFAWKKNSPEPAMQWTLGATAIFTPYIWGWDFVLLLPLWISTFARAHWKNKIFLTVVYLLAWAGMLFSQISANGNNQAFWWVPLWFMGAIAIMKMWELNRKESNP